MMEMKKINWSEWYIDTIYTGSHEITSINICQTDTKYAKGKTYLMMLHTDMRDTEKYTAYFIIILFFFSGDFAKCKSFNPSKSVNFYCYSDYKTLIFLVLLFSLYWKKTYFCINIVFRNSINYRILYKLL